MNLLGLFLTTILGISTHSFVLTDLKVAQYCSDVPGYNCSLIDCNKFPDEASHFCPKKCGVCHTCEDNVKINCTFFTSPYLCTNSHLLQYAAQYCPRQCNFCTPCIDSDDRCQGLKNICNNSFYAAQCPRTCKACKSFDPDKYVQSILTTAATTAATSAGTAKPLAPSIDSVPTTTPPSTFFTTAPTLQPIIAKNCDKLGVIVEVAKGNSVSYPGIRSCADDAHQPSEALVHKFCGAPGVPSWTEGVKVLENCQRIPHYSPIAATTSVFGGSIVAGVFVKCEDGGFQAAIQTCQSELKIVHVSTNSTTDIPSAVSFVVLDW